MEIHYKHLNEEKLLPDGRYIIATQHIFNDSLFITVTDGVFIDDKTGLVFDVENQDIYTHYILQEESSDLTDLNPDEWYCSYERIVDIETYYCDKRQQPIFYFEDTKNVYVEVYTDNDNNTHFEINNSDLKYMSSNGWKNVNTPLNFKTFSHVCLSPKDMDLWHEIANTFIKEYSLQSICKEKTERGFSIQELVDFNGNSFQWQESSVATEDRVWFGANDYNVVINDKEYTGQAFEGLIRNNQLPEINNINEPFNKNILCSNRMELSTYHLSAIINKLQQY